MRVLPVVVQACMTLGLAAPARIGASAPAQKGPLPMHAYRVAASAWAPELGHFRARIHVAAPASCVRIRVAWRRRDRDPAAKDVIVVDAATGKRVMNVARIAVERECGDIAFEPATAPGDYFLYYMPYAPEVTQYYYGRDYTPPSQTADAGWLRAHGLDGASPTSGRWESLPEATVACLEARTAFDSVYPMEVVATRDEVAALLAAHTGPYLLFPDDRLHAIRMSDDLPVRWVTAGPATTFRGQAERNEYYPFQIGVYAARQALANLAISFGQLRPEGGGAAIPATSLRCINLGGRDTDGHAFTKRVDVPQGRVQALWIGVDVPADAAPGVYSGQLTVSADNAPPTPVQVTLEVGAGRLADRGDSELWRFSRLRWLDSAAGIDDEVVAPYTPLRVSGRTVRCLGRQVRIGDDGMLASIQARGREVLARPIRLAMVADGRPLELTRRSVRVTKRIAGAVEWDATADGPDAAMTTHARMEFDGHIQYRVVVRAKRALDLSDTRLELPVKPEVARYYMGAGRDGGRRPREYDWRWTTPHDSFWIGDVSAGVHCELRGGAYHGPLLNLFHPAPPPSWHNAGRGGVSLAESPDGVVVASAYSGPRQLRAEEEVVLEFALLVTPVKPLDTAAHFTNRYYHDGADPVIDKYSLDAGVNVLNVHHANAINPYINYPFLTTEALGAFVRKWQARGMKVKIYYTVRELTNYVSELWALRSLGHEVLAGGGGGGFPWLREHLGSDYTPQWFVPFPDGTADAAILTSGESRWYNYYVEGLAWLCKNLGIDGLYLDDVSYDRRILKRMRKVMERARPGSMIDLHSNTAFSLGPANQYAEFLPYIDRIWFGESFRYNERPPDYWLTEVSGIPFGVMGEMLQEPTNRWRGMLYGLTSRLAWNSEEGGSDPRPMWHLWNDFGITRARMVGYWDDACPVRTGRDDVLATVYARKGKALIALASWAPAAAQVHLQIDYKALGIDPARAVLRAPAVRDFQDATAYRPDGAITVEPARGWVLVLEETK